MGITKKKRVSAPLYISPNQLSLEGFQTPFEQSLRKDNLWVVLAHLIPWDEVCAIYLKHVGVSSTGRPSISLRVVLGSLIIKHLGNLDDRGTVEQIRENMYMQYFLGYSSFTSDPPFDPSLFVEFRKRLGMDNLNAIKEKIVALKTRLEISKNDSKPQNQIKTLLKTTPVVKTEVGLSSMRQSVFRISLIQPIYIFSLMPERNRKS